MNDDPSNGYEAIASRFMQLRGQSRIGLDVVMEWARALPPGAAILDLGCGDGMPNAVALNDAGFDVYGIDASPTLAERFRSRLPGAHISCESVETSRFFDRTFDGIIAIGLVFLLPADTQRRLIQRAAQALNPGGCFLFTSPVEECTWTDILTGQSSRSLGGDEYRRELAKAGLVPGDERVDEGGNYFHAARKPR